MRSQKVTLKFSKKAYAALAEFLSNFHLIGIYAKFIDVATVCSRNDLQFFAYYDVK